jgi:glycosyltransferase involved in cell wall biosynthesis
MLNGEGAKIIYDANCGLSVNAGDSIKLAEKVLELSEMSDNKRKILGANGFKYFEENFTMGKCIDNLETILNN